MARREHVAEPRKATWTCGRIHGRVDIVGLAFDGPMGIVRPGKMGGHTRSMLAMQWLKGAHHIPDILLKFLLSGTTVFICW